MNPWLDVTWRDPATVRWSEGQPDMDAVPFCKHERYLLSCEACMPAAVLSRLLAATTLTDHDFWPIMPPGGWSMQPDEEDDDTPRCPCCDRPVGASECTCKPCPDCKDGWYVGFTSRSKCATCEGAGWL